MSAYVTGNTEDGRLLWGGGWRMKHELGFPLDAFLDEVRSRNGLVDWMEAMADASIDDNLPALHKEMQALLPEEDLRECKTRFMLLTRRYTPQEFVDSKKRAS